MDTAAEIFASADMVVKVKEPQPAEWATASRKSDPLHLFRILHRTRSRPKAFRIRLHAIAYETVTDAQGGLPLLAPMSEVAGRLAIEAAGAA